MKFLFFYIISLFFFFFQFFSFLQHNYKYSLVFKQIWLNYNLILSCDASVIIQFNLRCL
ncbi:unnamed protein product [Meloidogyne enterolobii]|uniref:Uncharacterized protein n=1 Tax=Meloidogyne enterolobii TaxID=390850 RepID=A0ACB0YC25_MELEN